MVSDFYSTAALKRQRGREEAVRDESSETEAELQQLNNELRGANVAHGAEEALQQVWLTALCVSASDSQSCDPVAM